MIGISITMRKPRSGEYTEIIPGNTVDLDVGGIKLLMSNTREKPVYLKWRI